MICIIEQGLIKQTKHRLKLWDVPIVCGLKCVYTNELPDDTMFAVFEAANPIITKDEIITKLKDENRELHKQLERVYEIIGNMIDR